jgi:hypothetical protein
MKEDTIYRQAAIDAFQEDALYWDIYDGYIAPHYARKIVENLPSAHPERKKGKWLNKGTVFWQCDQCVERYTGRTKKIPNFCPNCGADMREEEQYEQ